MLLTGRHPQRGNVNGWTQADGHVVSKQLNMSLNEITIAEVLKGAGYKTAMFGKWHPDVQDFGTMMRRHENTGR
jgi:arylsulfatase A-like enzyme